MAMSRSNYDKPFYVDVGTSIVAVRCASNHDVVLRYDHSRLPQTIQLAEAACDRMNKEAEIGKPLRNCDVGTAEEQETRFNDYCRKHYDLTFDLDSDPCKACPFFAMPTVCRFAWAQMPYEAQEGSAK